MRLLHTSDWHLGKKLADRSRTEVFKQFFVWLLKTLEEQKVDLLLIAGDIFDGSMPSHEAQELYYEFLAKAVKTGCRNIVVIAGNHDSASFLEAPEHLLKFLNIYVVGEADLEKEVIEIKNAAEETLVIVCAVPFLKEKNLYSMGRDDDITGRDALIVQSTKKHFEEVTKKALKLRGEKNVPIIGTGHLFVAGSDVSATERQLYIGSLGQLPQTILPPELDYIGLGHIHKPQKVGADITRNYSGSPIALDFSEGAQRKIVRIVDFEENKTIVRDLEVPQFENLVLITGTQEELEAKLETLVEEKRRCLVRAEHTGTVPAKDLARRLRAISEQSLVEVVHIRDLAKKEYYLSSMVGDEFVQEMTPESVFEKLLEKQFPLAPGEEKRSEESEQEMEELRQCYQEILQEIRIKG